jgi:hypothetical protein
MHTAAMHRPRGQRGERPSHACCNKGIHSSRAELPLMPLPCPSQVLAVLAAAAHCGCRCACSGERLQLQGRGQQRKVGKTSYSRPAREGSAGSSHCTPASTPHTCPYTADCTPDFHNTPDSTLYATRCTPASKPSCHMAVHFPLHPFITAASTDLTTR